MREAVKRTGTIERGCDASMYASELRGYRGADSTRDASHGSRIVALGP